MTDNEKRILLIDDDTSLLLTLSDFLRFEGYDVTTADSGEQGLKRLKRMKPDLIILDMSMPGMGGVGFLKEISKPDGIPKHPVLVLTARANMAEFFSDVDVEGFVAKPCDPNDLLMEVSRIIFLRRGQKDSNVSTKKVVKHKILLGEDDSSISKIVSAKLSSHSMTVELVEKGPDVLEKAIVEKPDLILMKFMFTSMNGDAIAAMLKEMPNTSEIPIVLYDDSGADFPESKFVYSGSPIKKFVRSSDAGELKKAVDSVLAV